MKIKIATLLLAVALSACVSAPPTFSRNKPGWMVIELRNGISKDEVWGKVSDSLKERDLEFEKIDKDVGYMRTVWKYEITQKFLYSTRIIVDFPFSGKTLRIKSEAYYQVDGLGEEGFDTVFTQTIKDEITALVGRK